MSTTLLAYLSADYDDDDVDATRALVADLASGSWSAGPPEFVDDTDASSCTRPEDRPIRTVGVVLPVGEASDRPSTPREEAASFVSALEVLSRERDLEFELQLGQTYVGTIRAGVADRLVQEGLLAEW